MAISDSQEIGPFFFGQDAEFDANPETPGSIDLNALKCDLLSWDGTRVIKTLISGNGLTVNGTTNISLKWATDELGGGGVPLFPPGRYQYQIWTITAGARHPVSQGPFEVQTRDF